MRPLRLGSLPETLRDEIRRARQVRGWSQAELGRQAGLTQRHVSAIETGRLVPRFDTTLDLLRCLGLDIIVVPRAMVPMMIALARGEDPDRPLYAVDGDEDEDAT
jgi:transcriptional regulator with XRE-family HTH domain